MCYCWIGDGDAPYKIRNTAGKETIGDMITADKQILDKFPENGKVDDVPEGCLFQVKFQTRAQLT